MDGAGIGVNIEVKVLRESTKSRTAADANLQNRLWPKNAVSQDRHNSLCTCHRSLKAADLKLSVVVTQQAAFELSSSEAMHATRDAQVEFRSFCSDFLMNKL